jgi:hypothetical protein
MWQRVNAAHKDSIRPHTHLEEEVEDALVHDDGTRASSGGASVAAARSAGLAALAARLLHCAWALDSKTADAHLERQQELVALEQAAARVLIDLVRVPVVDGTDALCESLCGRQLFIVKAELRGLDAGRSSL